MALCRVLAVLWLCFAMPALAKDTWISVQTKHFTFISSANEARTRELAIQLEQFRFVVGKLFNVESPAAPVTIVVFKSEAAFRPFKPLYNGKPAPSLAGYCTWGGAEDMVALNIEQSSQALEIIQHEYTHVLTRSMARYWPTWLVEGEAEVLSTFRWTDNKAELGYTKKTHLQTLATSGWMSLDRLFDVTSKSPEYNERNRQSVFYAESWLLAHYLHFGDSDAHQGQLHKFTDLLQAGRDPKDAFREALGSNFAAVEQALRRYVSSGRYLVTKATYSHPDIDRSVKTDSVTDADLLACFGTLLADTERAADAKSYLDRAVALSPDSSRAHQSLGFLAFRQKDFAAAIKHYEQSVKTGDSPNYLAHFYYATALFNEKIGTHFVIGRVAPETAQKIGVEALRAIQLFPTYAPAYDLLGLIHLAANDNLPEGVKMADTAIRLDPLNMQYRLTLAQLQLAQQNEAAARATLMPLLGANADPDLKADAQFILKEIDRRNAGH